MDRKTLWLCTLERQASVAPFVGLFGTVFGIVRAFERLERGTENSISVAIFEALVFTGAVVPILLSILLIWEWLSEK